MLLDVADVVHDKVPVVAVFRVSFPAKPVTVPLNPLGVWPLNTATGVAVNVNMPGVMSASVLEAL